MAGAGTQQMGFAGALGTDQKDVMFGFAFRRLLERVPERVLAEKIDEAVVGAGLEGQGQLRVHTSGLGGGSALGGAGSAAYMRLFR